MNFGPSGSRVDVDLKPCPFLGCDELVPKSARGCVLHKNTMSEKEVQRRKNHPRRLIYADPRWKTCKKQVFLRDNWTCQYCKEVQDYMNRHRLLSCDHWTEGGVMNCPDPFNPYFCITACNVCSGKKDGARGNQKSA
jgi:hypothetical protein